jgi:hypothetical protein
MWEGQDLTFTLPVPWGAATFPLGDTPIPNSFPPQATTTRAMAISTSPTGTPAGHP